MRPRRAVGADVIFDMLIFFANAIITRGVITRRVIARGVL
jgi:hypothetical protein